MIERVGVAEPKEILVIFKVDFNTQYLSKTHLATRKDLRYELGNTFAKMLGRQD